MHKNISFKICVTDDNAEDSVLCEIKLPYDIVSQVVANLPDAISLNDFYELASMHPSPDVREYVAAKDNINEDLFNILANDNSINVLRSLSRSLPIKKFSDFELLKKLILLDSECAQNIANNYLDFENVESEKVLDLLLQSNDPSIRYAVANNYSGSKKVARRLIDDLDPKVSYEANRRLED